MATETFHFTPENTEELRAAYQEAEANEAESFIFHGHTLLTKYAMYLLQYLDIQFKEADHGH